MTVPSSTLLKKTVEEIEKEIREKVGVVGGGKKEWRRVTVGIINSVINEAKDNSNKLKQIEVCIRDECHESAQTRHEALSNHLTNCYYSIGLSATVDRADGKLILIEGSIGPTVLNISEKEVSSKNVTIQPTVIKIPFKHKDNTIFEGALEVGKGTNKYIYNTPNGKPDVAAVYKKAVESNLDRDKLIIDINKILLESPIRKGGILNLVKGVEHGKRLSLLAEQENIFMPFLSGKNSVEERLKYLELLRNRELDILCATSIFNQGEDIKPLEFVVLAAAGSNKRILIQQIGRVVRSCEGKKIAVFIDIADEEVYYLTTHSNKRDKIIEERHKIKLNYVPITGLEKFLSKLNH